MNDKDRMIEKQLEVIRTLTANNLRRVSSDLFGNSDDEKKSGQKGNNNDE